MHRMSLIGFQLVYLYLTLAHSQGHIQGHVFFVYEYLKQWQIGQTLLMPIHRKSPIGFRLVI